MTDKSGPKVFTDLVERLLFSSPSKYLYIVFFLFGAKPKSTRAFFFAPLLAGHSLCPQKLELGSMDAPHEIGHFFGGECKLDAKMSGSFEAFPL